jgi:hypothetical protein
MTSRARDARTLFIGIAGGFALTLCLGQAAPRDRRQPQPPIAQQIVQRYQISAINKPDGAPSCTSSTTRRTASTAAPMPASRRWARRSSTS